MNHVKIIRAVYCPIDGIKGLTHCQECRCFEGLSLNDGTVVCRYQEGDA